MAMDIKIASLVKALAYAENGGKPDIKNLKAGKTGEMKSMFQFTPDTWKLYSKQISGQDNLPLTPENESAVVYGKVQKWVQDGYLPEQIASMWNAGEQRPDAYKQNWKGINKKYGVAFDTPAYAKKVSNYAKQFEGEKGVSTSTTKPSKTDNQITMDKTAKPVVKPIAQPQMNTATLPQLFAKQARQV